MPQYTETIKYKDYNKTPEQMYDLVIATLNSLGCPIKLKKEDKIVALGPVKQLGFRMSKITILFYDVEMDITSKLRGGQVCDSYNSNEKSVKWILQEIKDIQKEGKKEDRYTQKKLKEQAESNKFWLKMTILFYLLIIIGGIIYKNCK